MIDAPQWADKFIRIPFEKYKSSMSGCDCLGLIQVIYKEQFGIVLPDYVHTDPQERELTGLLLNKYKEDWIKLPYPEWNAVIIFNMSGEPLHLGMVLSDDYMIHVQKGQNSVIERFTGMKWRKRIEGFYKWHCM